MTNSNPIPPPQQALRRVLAISRANGWSVIVVAILGGLIALAIGDWFSFCLGVLVAVFGWLEVRGHRMLRRRDPEGMKWLVRSQLFLLSLILAYCASRLGSFDGESMMANLTPDMESILREAGIERADIVPLVRMMFFALYGTVAFVSVLYQGGLALYYRGKTRLVAEALSAPPPVPPHTPLA